MKVTLKEIIEANPAITRLAGDKTLSVKLSYKILMLTKAFQGDVEFFNSKRFELLEKYGTPQDGGYNIPPENMDNFIAALDEVGAVESKVEIEKIDISLGLDIGLSAVEIDTLLPFFNFVDEQ